MRLSFPRLLAFSLALGVCIGSPAIPKAAKGALVNGAGKQVKLIWIYGCRKG